MYTQFVVFSIRPSFPISGVTDIGVAMIETHSYVLFLRVELHALQSNDCQDMHEVGRNKEPADLM